MAHFWSAAFLVLLVAVLSSTQRPLKLGFVVEFDEDIVNGVTNETVEQAIQSFRKDANLMIQSSLIPDIDAFAAEAEDNPASCGDLTAVISLASCGTTKQLYNLVANFCPSTLIVAVHDRLCERPVMQHGLGFPSRTSFRDVFPMLMDMRHDFLLTWDKISIVHDDSVDTASAQDLVNGLTQEYVYGIAAPDVTLFRVNSFGYGTPVVDHTNCLTEAGRASVTFTSAHLMDHLKSNGEMKFFIVIGKTKTIENIIEEAHNKSLLNPPRRWLFVFTDKIVKKKEFWSNIGPILALTETAVVRRTISPYSRCGEFSEGCQFRLAVRSLQTSLSRVTANITLEEEQLLSRNRKLLKNRILTDMRQFLHHESSSSCGSCDRFELQIFEKKEKMSDKKPWLRRKPTPPSVWVKDQDFDVHIHSTGEWTPVKGYLAKNQVFSAWARDESAPFGKQKVLNVAVFEQKPRLNVVRNSDGSCIVNGSAPAILELLSERLNFTIAYNCDETSYGHKENGQWTKGVMKLLHDGKVDMLVNPIWKLPANEKLWTNDEFMWSRAFWEDSAALMVQKSTEDHAWLFMLPFTWDVWYALVGCILLISPFTYYINRRCKYFDYNNVRKDKGFFSMINCLWYTYAAMVGQGGDYLPPAIAPRVIVAFWWLFVIVVATTYSGNLVACLTFPKIFQPIQNAQDLLRAWFMDWATQIDGPIEVVTKTEQFWPIALLRKGMEYMDFERNKEYIFDEVASDSLAWVGMEEEVKYHVSTDYLTSGVCHMHRAKDDVYRAPVYFAFRKNFDKSLVDAINYEIQELGGAGFLVHWFKYYNQLGNDCLHPTLVYAGDVRRIEIMHMYGCYIVLGFGIAASVVAIISELLYWKAIRPFLPESFTNSNVSIMDYYNKIFIGYGYSNHKVVTPPRPKKETVPNNKNASLSPAVARNENENNNNISNSNSNKGTPSSRSSLGSANSRTGLYDNRQQNTNYNTKQNYNSRQNYINNYSNYVQTQKSEFRSKFGI